MQFTITGKDQASQVITAVNKKISEFGKDVGRSIVGMVGPMALVGFAISKISDYLEDVKEKAKEAFEWGSQLTDNADKLNLTAEQFQRVDRAATETSESAEKVGKAFKLASDLIQKGKDGNKEAIESLAALGIKLDDIDKAKPEDVLRAIATALNQTVDPADKATVAIAALGSSAKDLQETLAKGFDIAGALEDTEGLTNEEAALLRQQARKEKAKANREKLENARQQATQAFLLEDPEGLALMRKRREQSLSIGEFGGALSETEFASQASKLPEVQSQVQALLRQRTETKPLEGLSLPEVIEKGLTAAFELLRVGNSRKMAEEREKERSSKIKAQNNKAGEVVIQSSGKLGKIKMNEDGPTVSSLREIGGGIAGENFAAQLDYSKMQVDLQEKMLKELETLNNRSRDTIDFTKFPQLNSMIPGRTLA